MLFFKAGFARYGQLIIENLPKEKQIL